MRTVKYLDPVLDRLQGVRQSAEWAWTALCPAHEDNRSSLSVGLGDDSRVLLKCHAGCPTEAVVESIGMKMADLMPPREEAPTGKQPPPKREVIASYDYTDAEGNLLYQVLRYQPKDFRQRRPKAGGGWEWSLNGTPRVLYRLPDLAAKPGSIVFITEGEKDVDRLRGMGLVATTNVGGAGKWLPDYTEALRDRLVCILPDNDQPGRDHAHKIAKALHGVATKVKVVVLPDLPPKGDTSDWLDRPGNSKERLLEIIKDAPAWTDEQAKIQLSTLADEARRYIQFIRDGGGTTIPTGLPEVDYAIGDGVEESEVIVIGARPNHGKSMVALQCVHTWTSRGLPCLFISIEMASLQLGKRTMLYASEVPQEHWRTRLSNLQSSIDEYQQGHAPCYVVENVSELGEAIEIIERAVVDLGVKCVAVDYAQLLKAKGASSYEQSTIVSKELKRVAKKHKLVLLALCQLNRMVESRQKFIPKPSDLKDSGQWEQDADVILLLVWPHRIDDTRDPNEYLIFVGKNRNREIRKGAVVVNFLPSRQMLVAQEKPAYEDFDPFK